MIHWLFWLIGGCVLGFVVTWVAGELARGPKPRWFEITRYTIAGWRHRQREYWIGYYTAIGDTHMANFVARDDMAD